MTPSRNDRGFTLLEVVIAMMLMAFLTVITAQAIHRAIHSKIKVQTQIDKYSTLRDALMVMERDINLAYNYHDVPTELYNQSLKARQQQQQKTSGTGSTVNGGNNPNNPNQPNQPTPVNPTGAPGTTNSLQPRKELIISGFLGDKHSLNFTSLANVRLAEDSQMSSQAEIGYFLKNCRKRTDQAISSQCLWRRVSPIIDDDLEKGGESTVLLENVNEFSLRYLGPDHEKEWIDQWFTDARGDDTTKNKFPYAVEITLSVLDKTSGKKDKPLAMTVVAEIRNPNNPPKKDLDPNASQANQ